MNVPFDVSRIAAATTASERTAALCDFIEFWLGERKREYGESKEALDATRLPEPLRALYGFAGRWPDPGTAELANLFVPHFCRQDHLVLMRRIERADDDKIVFLQENQGVWDCRTLANGEDPPVWVHGDFYVGEREVIGGEHLICESLSRFLVTFVLQELTLGAPRVLRDDRIQSMFESDRENARPVWIDGPYVNRKASFYLWNDLLVQVHREFAFFAASNERGKEFLDSHQGPIDRIFVTIGRHWGIDLYADGSAEATYRQGRIAESCRAPARTFDFPEQLRRFEAAIPNHEGRRDPFSEPRVGFGRAGQHVAEARAVQDHPLVASLIERTFAESGGEGERMRRRFESERPL